MAGLSRGGLEIGEDFSLFKQNISIQNVSYKDL